MLPRSVGIRRVCSDDDPAECRYGRDINRLWALPIAIVDVVERLFGGALAIGFLVCILILIIGRERWEVVRTRVNRLASR